MEKRFLICHFLNNEGVEQSPVRVDLQKLNWDFGKFIEKLCGKLNIKDNVSETAIRSYDDSFAFCVGPILLDIETVNYFEPNEQIWVLCRTFFDLKRKRVENLERERVDTQKKKRRKLESNCSDGHDFIRMEGVVFCKRCGSMN